MNGWQQFIQIALPCLKFSPQIALTQDTEKLESELRILEAGAGGEITTQTKKLSKKYFYYADWLMREKKLEMGSDAIEYFFNYHNCTPSENLKSIGEQGKSCKTRIVELVDKKEMKAWDVITGEELIVDIDFIPGSSILENLNKLDKLVLMSEKPKVYILNPKMKEKVRNNLKKINFKIGPWINLDSRYYITHWNVLSYSLDQKQLQSLLQKVVK